MEGIILIWIALSFAYAIILEKKNFKIIIKEILGKDEVIFCQRLLNVV